MIIFDGAVIECLLALYIHSNRTPRQFDVRVTHFFIFCTMALSWKSLSVLKHAIDGPST